MLTDFIDRIGDGPALLALGLVVGVVFGLGAQRSQFCLRAAAAELSEGRIGHRMAIWLIVFCTAIFTTQSAIALRWLVVSEARQIAAPGSLSGAIIGGLMFGAGMILARGCASRLLVLSATGNLRALISGLVLTLVAQAALRGGLSPAREALAGLWVIPGGPSRDLLQLLSLGSGVAVLLSALALGALLVWAVRGMSMPATRAGFGLMTGLAIALGWVGTYQLSLMLFDPVPVSSVTFTGPSTDTLMALIYTIRPELSFGLGLVPGVFLGAGLGAVAAGEFAIQRFGRDTPMERYLIGATLMGFGAMLAGGCAVGAGVSGGAIFALTAWVAVFFMWAGAMLTEWAMRRVGAVRPA